MKAVIFGFVLVVLIVGISGEELCKDGETKSDRCNSCVCYNGVYACTLALCLDRKKRAPEPACTPGETKQEECNSCRCTETGVFICTKKFCIRNKREEPACTPGETKQVECNSCTCTETGVLRCTEKLCLRNKREAIAARFHEELLRPKRDTSLADDLKNAPCAPNDFFKLDCNTCYCNIDRTGYLCTENICIEREIITNHETTTIASLTNGSEFNGRHEFAEPIIHKDNDSEITDNVLNVSTSGSTYRELKILDNFNINEGHLDETTSLGDSDIVETTTLNLNNDSEIRTENATDS